jgi:hypothetical protein
VRRLPLLERRFCLVLMATLVVTMSPLTWEAKKAVWFVLVILVGFSEALKATPTDRVASRIRPGPIPVGASTARRPVGPAAALRRDAGA